LNLGAGLTTDQIQNINFNDYLFANKWVLQKMSNNNFQLRDVANTGLPRFFFDAATGNSYFDAAGTGIIIYNGLTAQPNGTGGYEWWSGRRDSRR